MVDKLFPNLEEEVDVKSVPVTQVQSSSYSSSLRPWLATISGVISLMLSVIGRC